MSYEREYEARFGGAAPALPDAQSAPSLQTLLDHRTHRQFSDRAVDDNLLQLLLAAAFSAPSKSDLQQATVIRVRSSQTRAAIRERIPAMPWIAEAPVFYVFCADARRVRRMARWRGKPFANDNLDNFLAAAFDVGLVMQAFLVAAESVGLGCCPISVIRDHAALVAQKLQLPDFVFPVAGLCVGYPAREGFVSMRLPLALTVHEDVYRDEGMREAIDDYDQRRDQRFSIPADRQKYAEQYGVAGFYGWSEDKARQMSREERAGYGEFIRERGFALR